MAAAERVIIRHDRPDSSYLALGARYPAVVRVGERMGDGTLVGDRWVLTAAHVARGVMARSAEPTVRVGDRVIRVSRAFIHPKWVELAPQDIALLELAERVTDVYPIALYEKRDEAGQVATLVGHGRTGSGDSRERRDDDRKRGATNRVEQVRGGQLVFRFDAPPAGTDLEGIPGAGDSGGPALVARSGRVYVIGVSSAGEPGRDGPGTYGALDYFTRVSSHIDWIKRVMDGREAPSAALTTTSVPATAAGSADGTTIPDSPAGRRLRALTALIASGDTTRIDAFIRDHVQAGQPIDAQRARFRRLMDEYRGLAVIRVLLGEPHHVDVLVRIPAGDRILGVQVESPAATARITGVLTGRP